MNNLLLILTTFAAVDSGCLGLLIFHNRTLLYHQAVLACAQDEGSLWDCTEDQVTLHMMHGCVGKYRRFWIRSNGNGKNACQFDVFGFHCTKEFEYSRFLSYFCKIQSETDAVYGTDHVLCADDNLSTTSSALPSTRLSSPLHLSPSKKEPSSAIFTLTSLTDDALHTSVSSLTKITSFAPSNSTYFSINGSDVMPLAIMAETTDDKGLIVAAVICPLIVVTLIVLYLIWRRFSTEFTKPCENVYVNTSKLTSHRKPRFSASDIVIIRDRDINDENIDIRNSRVTSDNSKRNSDCKIPEEGLSGYSDHNEKETIYCNIDDVYLEPIQLFHRDSQEETEVMKTDNSKKNFATENVEESNLFEYSLASALSLDIESQYINQDLYSVDKTSTEKIRSDEHEEAVYAVCDMDTYHHLCKDERKSENEGMSQMYSKARNPDNMDAVDDFYDHISAEKIAEDAQFALPDFEKEADC